MDGLVPIRSGKPGRLRSVGGCAERVCAHVSDARGLCGSPGSSHGRGRAHCVRGPTSNESSAYLSGSVEFTASECPRSSDGVTWSTIGRSLRFEQDQDSLSTLCRPPCDLAAIGFAERLRGRHISSLAQRPAGRSVKRTNPQNLVARHAVQILSRTAHLIVTIV
ncbi:hypothetical protein GCM10009747_12020 [Agromyces humatus]|uniref:Uncharacterized protein n=1 Tax=Agromyces humatus TaxID=279573 RepID=A0ABP4WLJ9_9MICO